MGRRVSASLLSLSFAARCPLPAKQFLSFPCAADDVPAPQGGLATPAGWRGAQAAEPCSAPRTAGCLSGEQVPLRDPTSIQVQPRGGCSPVEWLGSSPGPGASSRSGPELRGQPAQVGHGPSARASVSHRRGGPPVPARAVAPVRWSGAPRRQLREPHDRGPGPWHGGGDRGPLQPAPSGHPRWRAAQTCCGRVSWGSWPRREAGGGGDMLPPSG